MTHSTRTALLLLAIVAIVDGVLGGLLADRSIQLQVYAFIGSTVAILAVLFWWLHHDAVSRGIRRSRLMNVGIAVAGIIFVPVYLYRSRAPGARIVPILAFCGIVLGYGVLSTLVSTLVSYAA
jgi:hypothetical protein